MGNRKKTTIEFSYSLANLLVKVIFFAKIKEAT